jgi:hypothetical protein
MPSPCHTPGHVLPCRIPDIWPAFPVHPGVTVRVLGTMPPLDSALDAAVETRWQAACVSRRLFNGRVFSADRVTPGLIEGHWTEYRRLVAAWADPIIFDALRPRALAVCGLLRCPEGIVLGRRSLDVAYLAGCWQAPPAGSLDPRSAEGTEVNPLRALIYELREELGLEANDLSELPRPLCLVEHSKRGVLDLAYALHTTLPFKVLAQLHRTQGDGEYTALIALPELDAETAPSDLSPATQALLRWER